MPVIKVIELVGTSGESWEGAVRQVVADGLKTVRNVKGVDLVKQTAHVEGGKITESTVHVAFVVENID